jgi:hypothetical protein
MKKIVNGVCILVLETKPRELFLFMFKLRRINAKEEIIIKE